jgi:putative RNA 2'-phosphotransferase
MLNEQAEMKLSKWMSKLLRHDPESHGLHLEPADGSCTLDELLQALRRSRGWGSVTVEDIRQVVRNSDKQRFEIIEDRIRARYGHSHSRVAYEAAVPPAVLYHGTNTGALASLLREGIKPMSRQYVHLSEGLQFATLAGARRGELVIVAVDTVQAAAEGTVFYYGGNEVWLADSVPANCLKEHNA